jgi:hypothetical protein
VVEQIRLSWLADAGPVREANALLLFAQSRRRVSATVP